MSLLQPNKNSLSNADQERRRRGMSSMMVGNSGSKEAAAADARMRLAMSRHQVRSFVRRQEKVGRQAVVSWANLFGRKCVHIGHGQALIDNCSKKID